MMCEACQAGHHYACGLQTWCECDDAADGLYEAYEPDEDGDDELLDDLDDVSECHCGAYQWSDARGHFIQVADCCCPAVV